jgi:hypothetical protein
VVGYSGSETVKDPIAERGWKDPIEPISRDLDQPCETLFDHVRGSPIEVGVIREGGSNTPAVDHASFRVPDPPGIQQALDPSSNIVTSEVEDMATSVCCELARSIGRCPAPGSSLTFDEGIPMFAQLI